MPTPDPHDPEKSRSISAGYEITDANVFDVGLFLASLGGFAVVAFIFCFGMGKVINTAILRHDGPANQWNAIGTRPAGKRENMPSDAALEQQQLRQMTQRFPTPRLQTDNGDQDITDMHAREDLLLDHYSWVDRQQGKVRIPIARAMELLARDGLPVAPPEQTEPLMAGDKIPVVTEPLTDGFARTGYEQYYMEMVQQRRQTGAKPGDQAVLGANH